LFCLVRSAHKTVLQLRCDQCLLLLPLKIVSWFCRAMLRKRGLCRHAVSVCLCVCVCMYVCLSRSKRINTSSKFFSPSGSLPFLFFHTKRRGNIPTGIGGVECKWGRQKSRFWAYIWLHCVLSKLWPARCYQHGARQWQVVTLIAGSKRRCLLTAEDDDEMFMTRSLNVTPKTTEQHLIARSDKSVAYVTNNKRLCSTFCTTEGTDWHEASRSLFATAELLVLFIKRLPKTAGEN